MAPLDSPSSHPLLGIEIADSATRLTACLPSLAGTRRWHTRLPAPPTPAEAVTALTALVNSALRDTAIERLAAVGIAVWARVDARSGIIIRLGHTSDWDGYPLAPAASAALGVPVVLASATEAAALAEAANAQLVTGERLLYISIGRAITSALVVNGVIEGGEGLLGHLRVRDDGPRCSCGLRGHLEPIASAQSLVRTMIGLASDSDESHAAMLRITGGRAEAMTSAQVVALAAEGDPIAASIVSDAQDAIATALANATALAAPHTILLGGPLTETGDAFLSQLNERFTPMTAPFTPPPSLRWAALEPFAALQGAAILAATA